MIIQRRFFLKLTLAVIIKKRCNEVTIIIDFNSYFFINLWSGRKNTNEIIAGAQIIGGTLLMFTPLAPVGVALIGAGYSFCSNLQ